MASCPAPGKCQVKRNVLRICGEFSTSRRKCGREMKSEKLHRNPLPDSGLCCRLQIHSIISKSLLFYFSCSPAWCFYAHGTSIVLHELSRRQNQIKQMGSKNPFLLYPNPLISVLRAVTHRHHSLSWLVQEDARGTKHEKYTFLSVER